MFDDFEAMNDENQGMKKKKVISAIKQKADTDGMAAAKKSLAFEEATEANMTDQLFDLDF